jgi:SAM-dependent methyltransferase
VAAPFPWRDGMNPAIALFSRYAGEYDRWFDLHPGVYEAQLARLRPLVPRRGEGLEIGVGSGRFAAGLGIRHGLDPSGPLLAMARQRGVEAVLGMGEFLPYRSGTFDYALMMTVCCFLEDIDQSFREACRVIRPGGTLVIGFLESGGEAAIRGEGDAPAGRFLHHARFRSGKEVTGVLVSAGFVRVVPAGNLHGLCIVTAQKE